MADLDYDQNDVYYDALEEIPRWRFGFCFGSNCVWVTFCVAMLLVFILITYVTEVSMANRNVPYLYLILLMLLAGIGQIYCICKRDNNDFVRFVPMRSKIADLYIMVGLYLFGSGTLLSVVLQLSLFIHSSFLLYNCYSNDEFKVKVDGNIFFHDVHNNSHSKMYPTFIYGGYCETLVAYNIFRLLFILLQVGFIHSFRHASFLNSSKVKFILYQTLLTNICIWFKYVSDETALFGEHKREIPGADDFTITAEDLKDKLNPFILEFSLIAAGIFTNISSNMQDNFDRIDNENIHAQQLNNGVAGNGTQPGLLLGVSFGLILISLGVMFDNSNNKMSEKSKGIFLIFESFYTLSQITAVSIALYLVVKQHREEDHVHNKWDYFLLAAAYLGTFVFDFVVIYGICRSIHYKSNMTFDHSGIKNPYQSRDDILTLVLSFCLALFHLIQMFAIIVHFRRYGCNVQQRSAGWIRQLILFLISTNMGSWGLDSFIEIKNHVMIPYYSAAKNFDGWNTLLALSFPFCVFFRFHSALLLFEFWQRFKFG